MEDKRRETKRKRGDERDKDSQKRFRERDDMLKRHALYMRRINARARTFSLQQPLYDLEILFYEYLNAGLVFLLITIHE